MLNGIKITQDEMKFIQLLQNMTGATIVDCIIEGDTIIFTVKKGEVGLAVGKGGEKIKRFRSMTNKQVEIYEYLNEAEKFITNALKPARSRTSDWLTGWKVKRSPWSPLCPRTKASPSARTVITSRRSVSCPSVTSSSTPLL